MLGKAKALLLHCRGHMLRPQNPNHGRAHSLKLFQFPYDLFRSSRKHNLISSSTFLDQCTCNGRLLARSLPMDSPGEVQISFSLPFSRKSFCRSLRYSRRTMKLAEIVEEISRDSDGMEFNLSKLDFPLSLSNVAEIISSLNRRCVPADRFLNWILKFHSCFKPNSEIHNLIIDNLGRLDDYNSMRNLLIELSDNRHCLTEKSFAFMKFCSSSTITDSVRRLTSVLNSISGSCRNSGIHSLIKILCSMHSFELALSVMKETVRKTSYYNLMIAEKCRNGDFDAALCDFDDMRSNGIDPKTNSYNYLLGSLFKNSRVLEACNFLQSMEESGCMPDSITYEVVSLHACKANRLDYAIEILDLMLSKGMKPRPTTHAAFIKGFFRSGRIEKAYSYVIEMNAKDTCSNTLNYSLLASLFRSSGRAVEAGGILHEMMMKGLKPNFSIYIKVVKDLEKISQNELSLELKSLFLKFNSKKDVG